MALSDLALSGASPKREALREDRHSHLPLLNHKHPLGGPTRHTEPGTSLQVQTEYTLKGPLASTIWLSEYLKEETPKKQNSLENFLPGEEMAGSLRHSGEISLQGKDLQNQSLEWGPGSLVPLPSADALNILFLFVPYQFGSCNWLIEDG